MRGAWLHVGRAGLSHPTSMRMLRGLYNGVSCDAPVPGCIRCAPTRSPQPRSTTEKDETLSRLPTLVCSASILSRHDSRAFSSRDSLNSHVIDFGPFLTYELPPGEFCPIARFRTPTCHYNDHLAPSLACPSTRVVASLLRRPSSFAISPYFTQYRRLFVFKPSTPFA